MQQITVGLPVYKSATIAWLAMESLCSQRTNVEWELIIAEEQEFQCGKDFFMSYESRLLAAKCVNIKYISLYTFIPLSLKWRIIANEAHPNSNGLILQAADCYSEPTRIETAYNCMAAGFDWVHSQQGIFYNIKTGKRIMFDLTLIQKPPYEFKTGLNMCVNMELARKLPDTQIYRHVDKWIFESISHMKDVNVYLNESTDYKQGLDTHGHNIISNRSAFFANPEPPFMETDEIENIPINIKTRLADMQPQLITA